MKKRSSKELRNIPINRIYPNPMQPRKIFDEEELQSAVEGVM